MLEKMMKALIACALRLGYEKGAVQQLFDFEWAVAEKISHPETCVVQRQERATMPSGLTPAQEENWRHMQRVRRACGADKEE